MGLATVLLAAASVAPPLSLEQALAIAASSNPEVVAARLELPVSEAAVSAARELPNPTFAGSYGPDSPQVTAGVEQRLPIFGQHGASVRAAEAERRVTGVRLAEASLRARAA